MSGARLELDGTPQTERAVWFCLGELRTQLDRLPPVVEGGGPGVPTYTEWDEVTLYQRANVYFVERRAWEDIHVAGDSSVCMGWQRSSDGARWESCREPDDRGAELGKVCSLA